MKSSRISAVFSALSILFSFFSVTASLCTDNPATVGINIGRAKAVIVSDGPIEIPFNPFSVPDDALFRSYRDNFRDVSRITIAQNILVVDLEAGRTLIDTGSLTNQAPVVRNGAGLLIPALKSAGITPGSIQHVILTHGHGSRVGGLRTLDGEISFPNATLYVARAEHQFWTTDPVPTTERNEEFIENFVTGYREAILPYEEAGQLQLVEENGMPIEGVQFVPSPGHTTGHTLINVTVDDEHILVTGDTWNVNADQVQNPDWAHFVDGDNEEAFRERIKVLERVAEERTLVLSFHDDFPGLGHIRKDRDTFDFVPMPIPNISVNVSRSCPCNA